MWRYILSPLPDMLLPDHVVRLEVTQTLKLLQGVMQTDSACNKGPQIWVHVLLCRVLCGSMIFSSDSTLPILYFVAAGT